MSQRSTRRWHRRVVIAVAAGAVVLAAVVFAVGVATDRPTTESAAVPAGGDSSAAASVVVPVRAGSICGLSGYDGSGSTLTAAPAASWSIVGTMAAPAAARVGPGRTSAAGLRSCYAHTVSGALFAAANVWAMGTDSRLNRLLLERQTVPDAGRDAALQADVPTSSTGLRAQVAAFRVTSYTGDAATVDLAFRLNTGELVSLPAPLAWSGGDWKVQLNDDGTAVYDAATLTSLAGYIPWAGPQ